MSNVLEHNPGDHEDPLSAPLWLVGGFGAVLLIVFVLGLIALYNNARAVEEDVKVVNAEPAELERLLAEQRLRLEIPHQVAYEDEIVTVIPIEHAMELVVQDYGAGR